jgi:hypothetical protein
MKTILLVAVTLLWTVTSPFTTSVTQLPDPWVLPTAFPDGLGGPHAGPSTQDGPAPAGHHVFFPLTIASDGLVSEPASTPTPTASPTALPPTRTPTSTPSPTPTPTPTPTLAPLVIGHITDVHIGAKLIYADRLPAVLQDVSWQADVMVDTGDCTENGTPEEAIEYMELVTANLTVPWRATPGNHDTPWVFEWYIGPLAWSWDFSGYRLIGIDTESIDYAALDQALTREKPCIVFGHFPLHWCSFRDQIELRKRFKEYNVPLYVCGHIHQNTIERDTESGALVTTGERSGWGHYSLITVRGYDVESIVFLSTFW